MADGSARMWQGNSRPGAQTGNRFQANPTLWGYVLQSDFQEPPMGLRRYTKFFAFCMFVITTLLWFAPGATGVESVLLMKLGLTLFFSVVGVVFYLAGPRQIRREVQIDLDRCQIRAGWLTSDRSFHLENLHDFDDVDVVMLWEDEATGEASLVLNIHDREMGLVVAQGRPEVLAPWRDEIARLLAPPAARYAARTAGRRNAAPLLLGPRVAGVSS